MTEPRRLGIVATLALGALLVVGLAFAASEPLTVMFYLAYVSVGAFLATRRPRNPIGWLLIAFAFDFVGTSSRAVDMAALAAGTASFGEGLAVWLGANSGTAGYLCFLALILIFPSGSLPAGRGRVASQIILLFGLTILVLSAFGPTVSINVNGGVQNNVVRNPFAVLPDLPLWAMLPPSDTAILPIIGLLVIGVGSTVVRYRRSSGILRLQLRWLVAAVAFLVMAVLFGLGSLGLFGDQIGGLAWVPAIIAYPTVPIAVGVAVLRYHLLEIDRIVSRTVAYALLTGVLAIVFVSMVLVVQGVLDAVTEGQTIAVAASTLAVFALFQPLRRRVQRTIDRRFDRARFDADRTAAAFSERLRHEVEIEAVSADLQGTVRKAVVPQSIGLWIRPTDSAGSRTS